MIFLNLLQFLLFIRVTDIHCHGDDENKPKVLLISIKSEFSIKLLNISKSFSISLPLKIPLLDSIVDGCHPTTVPKCEPVWVSNQINNFESALIDWPNQIIYGSTWPSSNDGCNFMNVPIQFKIDRLDSMISKPKTTLGMMTVNISSSEILNFLNNITFQVDKLKLNLIIIANDNDNSRFFARGPNFISKFDSRTQIRDVDIKKIIVKILNLKLINTRSDGNEKLAFSLTVSQNHHTESKLFKMIFYAVIISIAGVIGFIFVIEAVKNACYKKQRMNHHYNLGLNDISVNAGSGYPEQTYLLNISDEDELFSDAVPHIQTPTSQ